MVQRREPWVESHFDELWHSRPRLWRLTFVSQAGRVTLWIPLHSALPCGSLVRFMYSRNLPHFQVDDTPVFVTFRSYKLFYVLTNPIDAGLCKYPEDYRWLWRE